jgi:hypothetical protein
MSSERRMPDWASGDEHGRLAEWAGEGRHKLAHAPRGAQKGPAMPNNGKHTAKAAALIALKRAQQEEEPFVVAALIAIAIKQVELIDELVRPRRVRKDKELPL